MQLGQLQEIDPKLNEMGYQIIAIRPDHPEHLKQSMKKHSFTYLLLSDNLKIAARSFGLAFRVDEKSRITYEQYGIDIKAASGEPDLILPVPAVFIIGTDGIIRFGYVNPNYEVRLDPVVLLAAAKSALRK